MRATSHATGHEFCVELRKSVPDAVVPVIMVSAKNDEANIVEGLSHGCNDFVRSALPLCGTALQKPLTLFAALHDGILNNGSLRCTMCCCVVQGLGSTLGSGNDHMHL